MGDTLTCILAVVVCPFLWRWLKIWGRVLLPWTPKENGPFLREEEKSPTSGWFTCGAAVCSPGTICKYLLLPKCLVQGKGRGGIWSLDSNLRNLPKVFVSPSLKGLTAIFSEEKPGLSPLENFEFWQETQQTTRYILWTHKHFQILWRERNAMFSIWYWKAKLRTVNLNYLGIISST